LIVTFLMIGGTCGLLGSPLARRDRHIREASTTSIPFTTNAKMT
jgi:hypothetical protein